MKRPKFLATMMLVLFLAMILCVPSVGAKKIKIGVIGPMQFVQGKGHWNGATMAMEEINAAGGIAGNKLQIEYRDSTLKAPEAIKNARYFVDSWGADFLAGVDSSGQALALAPVMAELDRVLKEFGAQFQAPATEED